MLASERAMHIPFAERGYLKRTSQDIPTFIRDKMTISMFVYIALAGHIFFEICNAAVF